MSGDDLQERLQRLRQAGRLSRRGSPTPAPQPEPPAPASQQPPSWPGRLQTLMDLPGMEEVSGPQGRFLLRTLTYDLAHQQGEICLRDLLYLPAAAARLAGGDEALAELDFRRMAFVDTETSGLAGGAGTIVFLTGVGQFEGDAYVVRQYFARNPAEEPAYLHHLAGLLAQADGVVSFNGKAFDLPLLHTRFLLAGLQPLPVDLPHFDLLHPARRLWRARLGACNFGHLEQQVLRHRRSGNDVPSWLIPSLWFRFAAGEGNVEDMAGVLYHNQEDIVSMVPLAHVLCGTFAGVLDPHPEDLVSLARSHANQGLWAEAEAAYRRALQGALPRPAHIEAMMGLAAVLKRQGLRAQAAPLWEEAASLAPEDAVEPWEELAKYHEWETGDVAAATSWTDAGIAHVRGWRPGYRRKQVLAELEHRRQRLARK